jgi:hypothetical protein
MDVGVFLAPVDAVTFLCLVAFVRDILPVHTPFLPCRRLSWTEYTKSFVLFTIVVLVGGRCVGFVGLQ